MRIKHCVDNAPHLHILPLCHNQHTPLCSHHLNTHHHDLWAHTHYQFRHESHQLMFLSHLPLRPGLSRTLKLLHQCLFRENEKTQKLLSTHAFYTSTDAHQNSVLNKTRLLGFSCTCKLVQLVLGVNMLWLRSSKKPYGIILEMNCCKKSNVDLEIWTNKQLCRSKFEL